MWPFRSCRVGRHEVGAAVPSAAVALPVQPVPSYRGFSLPVPPPAAPAVAEATPAPLPRVELGFRDGTTAALAPGSAQARALTEIATAMFRRD
jgi:hypothetical protein